MLSYPIDLLRPTEMLWRRSQVADSDRAINGQAYARVTDGGGLWTCTMTVPLTNPDKVRTALAFSELAEGGATPFIVPVLNIGFQPYVGGVAPADVPFSDDSSFSDGSLIGSNGIKIALAENAALRATALVIRSDVAAALRGFEFFSFTHPTQGRRVYVVLAIQDRDDGKIDIQTRPPLREAVAALGAGDPPAETELDFDNPSCVMRLTNAAAAVAAIKRPVKSTLTLNFEEYFE